MGEFDDDYCDECGNVIEDCECCEVCGLDPCDCEYDDYCSDCGELLEFCECED